MGQGSFSKETDGKRVARASRDLVHIGRPRSARSGQPDVHEITTCTPYAHEYLKMHRNTLFSTGDLFLLAMTCVWRTLVGASWDVVAGDQTGGDFLRL